MWRNIPGYRNRVTLSSLIQKSRGSDDREKKVCWLLAFKKETHVHGTTFQSKRMFSNRLFKSWFGSKRTLSTLLTISTGFTGQSGYEEGIGSRSQTKRQDDAVGIIGRIKSMLLMIEIQRGRIWSSINCGGSMWTARASTDWFLGVLMVKEVDEYLLRWTGRIVSGRECRAIRALSGSYHKMNGVDWQYVSVSV